MVNVNRLISIATYDIGTNTLNMRRKCKSDRRLDGKVVVITGANTGIGKETALLLSKRGPKIYMGCRNIEKAESAINDIKTANPGADIVALKLDLASLKSVRQFASELKERESVIDILINNAGIMACPEWKTKDGFEMQFGTNYLGPFLLNMLLLPQLKQSSGVARIVNVSSSMHAVGRIKFDNLNLVNGAYNPTRAYGQSKLAVVLATREMARRLGPKSTVNCYVLNPGAVKTELQRHSSATKMMDSLFITPELGSQTTLYCSLDESLDKESGFYYDNCKRVDKMVKEATDDLTANKLWDITCDLVDIDKHLKI
ncbi:retinol dehydrogenase 13-like [Oppia nitens]|uniref:retinol dehydrogenase 13-like n=1 Tax=Oppia nitens TaxID=1686743 RepID=UPI0023DB2A67|nr:retinol dehydrogenase 13-like [Oppia nitens]